MLFLQYAFITKFNRTRYIITYVYTHLYYDTYNIPRQTSLDILNSTCLDISIETPPITMRNGRLHNLYFSLYRLGYGLVSHVYLFIFSQYCAIGQCSHVLYTLNCIEKQIFQWMTIFFSFVFSQTTYSNNNNKKIIKFKKKKKLFYVYTHYFGGITNILILVCSLISCRLSCKSCGVLHCP